MCSGCRPAGDEQRGQVKAECNELEEEADLGVGDPARFDPGEMGLRYPDLLCRLGLGETEAKSLRADAVG